MSTRGTTYGSVSTQASGQDTQVPALNLLVTIYTDRSDRFDVEAVSHDSANLVPNFHVFLAINSKLLSDDGSRAPHASIQKTATVADFKRLHARISERQVDDGSTVPQTENTGLSLDASSYQGLEKDLKKMAVRVVDAGAKRAAKVTREVLQAACGNSEVQLPPWKTALDIRLLGGSCKKVGQTIRIDVPTFEHSESGSKGLGSALKGFLWK